MGGLLGAILLAGLLALWLNQRIEHVATEALDYVVELEDQGDDLRVAVLDLREAHRNVALGGLTRGGVENFEEAYAQTLVEIDRLAELGVQDPDAPQPARFRELADEYYETFRPAIDLYDSDPEEFTQLNDQGLVTLSQLEESAREIDKLGEELAEESLERVQSRASTSSWILLLVVGGLVLVGAALGYALVMMVRNLRRLYVRETSARRELARLSQAKTEMIADASHELRTPLTVLRGNAEVGLEMNPNGDQREVLEEIVRESGRMTRIVEDLLFLSRFDAGTVSLEPERVEAMPFLVELSSRAESLARERDAYYSATLSGEGWLQVDTARIEQAVLVLVDNALKYGPKKGPVAFTSETRSGELLIEVSDKGPGIPEEDVPHIFDRFYRVDKARSRDQGGSGLGLSIAGTIVESHGGHIEVESRADGGTSMKIHLPLSKNLPASEYSAKDSA